MMSRIVEYQNHITSIELVFLFHIWNNKKRRIKTFVVMSFCVPRDGYWKDGYGVGSFSFHRDNGKIYVYASFRLVL